MLTANPVRAEDVNDPARRPELAAHFERLARAFGVAGDAEQAAAHEEAAEALREGRFPARLAPDGMVTLGLAAIRVGGVKVDRACRFGGKEVVTLLEVIGPWRRAKDSGGSFSRGAELRGYGKRGSRLLAIVRQPDGRGVEWVHEQAFRHAVSKAIAPLLPEARKERLVRFVVNWLPGVYDDVGEESRIPGLLEWVGKRRGTRE